MNVDELRAQIPVTRRMTYMNTGWAGPSPIQVTTAIRDRLDYEDQFGPASPEAIETRDATFLRAKETVAGLINASPQEVLLTQNTTEGVNVVMNGLSWEPGDEVITCRLEHPAITVPIIAATQQRGVKSVVLPIATDENHDGILSQVEAAITDRTRLVLLSHIEYSSGLRMPVKEIAELVRPRGIRLLLDGAQTAGHIPVDVRDLDCDFYAISGQKWLLGPDGTGALYIRESAIATVEPRTVGGKSVEDFAYPAEHQISSGIEKFSVSTKSVPLRAGFIEGINFVRSVGMERIEERSLDLASKLKAALASIAGVELLSPLEGPGCSGLVSFTIGGADPEASASTLWERHALLLRDVAYPPALRASLDFFNTEEEVAQLVDATAELARGG